MGFGFWSVRDEWMDLVGGWAVDRYGPIMGLFCGGEVRNLMSLVWMDIVDTALLPSLVKLKKC